MNMKGIIPLTEARKNLFQISEDVQKGDNYYILTSNGKAKAAILSAEDFDSWMETLDIMRTSPDLLKRIKQLEKDKKSGATKDYTSLEELLAEEGYFSKKLLKSKYAVSPRNYQTSEKRAK